jgi:hypothetical protein
VIVTGSHVPASSSRLNTRSSSSPFSALAVTAFAVSRASSSCARLQRIELALQRLELCPVLSLQGLELCPVLLGAPPLAFPHPTVA